MVEGGGFFVMWNKTKFKIVFHRVCFNMSNNTTRQAAVHTSARRGDIVSTPPNTTTSTPSTPSTTSTTSTTPIQISMYERWRGDGVGKGVG